ncbi:hypothetical protein G7082_01810 [Vagococcus hydrophili]|uniref:Uncharacterized protein n=2 Tax=Vagococcus hydrophili TaxID=2714947 RepID=A0A6G8AXM8_9ENTE|nr:hypothetical protein G7082_01810 [Vagococcus hydrophili]
MTVLGLGAATTHAAPLVGQEKETKTQVTIQDEVDPTDPLDPTDPDQKHLTLEKVPANYDFTSKLQNKNYALSAVLDSENTIEVFNDRVSREWSVKANVKGDEITVGESANKLPITSFKINDIEIAKTGANGIVAKNAEGMTAENNTGSLKTAVNKVNIDFSDASNVLKVNDKINGTIQYKLYNTATAE